VGVLFGIGIALFLRFVGRDTPLFILAICFAIWQISSAFHLEALLVALSAGFWVENFSRAEGEHLIKAIERLSLPVYALFFAAAGAKVDMDALAPLWPFALILAGARDLRQAQRRRGSASGQDRARDPALRLARPDQPGGRDARALDDRGAHLPDL